jgi:hypothetical protein
MNIKLKKNLDKLESFLSYKENWNGYGASPMSPWLIDSAKDIVKCLTI